MMPNKSRTLLSAAAAAASLVLATMSPTWAADEDAAAAADQKQESSDAAVAAPAAPAFPPGVKVDDDPEEERADLFKTFAAATEAALVKDGFDDFVERLVDQDRNRLGADGFTERKFDDLNAAAAALRAAWKEKYGGDDEVDVDEKAAFTKLAAVVGKIDDPQALAGAWPVAPVTDDPGAPGAEPVPAAAKETAGNEDPDLNSNIEKGRGVAIATLPASHGLPALNVSLIHELPGWRIDVPNALTGQQLHDSLLKHLTHLTGAQTQWPADKNEAALLVAHHVLLGAYGVDLEPAGDAADGAAAPGEKDAAADK